MEITHPVNCLYPNVVLNPNLRRLLRNGYEFSGFDRIPTLGNLKIQNYFPRLFTDFADYTENIYVAQERIQYILLNCYRYVVTRASKSYPVFYMCRCNHCVNCLEQKKNDLVQRVMLEAQSYEFQPMFLTLTYDDYHTDGLLHRKEFIDFVKRLRIRATRFVSRHPEWRLDDTLQTPYRYFACGEYGGRTQRPHFHLCLFNYLVSHQEPNFNFGANNNHLYQVHPDVQKMKAIDITKILISGKKYKGYEVGDKRLCPFNVKELKHVSCGYDYENHIPNPTQDDYVYIGAWNKGDRGADYVYPNGKKGKDLCIEFARNCGSYISKYMSKDISDKTKEHIADLCDNDAEAMKDYLPFIKYSQGLGRSYFDTFIRSSVTTGTRSIYVKNRLSHSPKDAILEIPLVGYWRDRVFPSVSKAYNKKHPLRTMLRHYCIMHDIHERYYSFVEWNWIHTFFKMYDPQIELFKDYFSFVDDSFSTHTRKILCSMQDISNQLKYLRHLVDYWIIKYEGSDFCVDDFLNMHLLNCEKLVAIRDEHLTNLLSRPREYVDPIKRYNSILNKRRSQTNKEKIQMR